MQSIIEELGGEKLDIILWNEDVSKFISAALSPAKVLRVDLDENEKKALAIVPEDQLSLAIGKRGQNVRLAAKLTGWRIDISGMANIEGEQDIKTEDENQNIDIAEESVDGKKNEDIANE